MTQIHCVETLGEQLGAENRPVASPADSTLNKPIEAAGQPETSQTVTLTGLVELILKDRPALHRLVRNPSLAAELMSRFLILGLLSFTFFGLSMGLIFSSAGRWPVPTPIERWLRMPQEPLVRFVPLDAGTSVLAGWLSAATVKLVLAYSLGLTIAIGICLPSLYFYGLLSGLRMSVLDVTIHALKGLATSAIALIGILPIYAALSMGVVIFAAPQGLLEAAFVLGLILPFIAGLWGSWSLYLGFAELCETMPEERRQRRACFLRRLVFSWGACYTAITPVVIHTLWQALGT